MGWFGLGGFCDLVGWGLPQQKIEKFLPQQKQKSWDKSQPTEFWQVLDGVAWVGLHFL